jgi:hypothetical protein
MVPDPHELHSTITRISKGYTPWCAGVNEREILEVATSRIFIPEKKIDISLKWRSILPRQDHIPAGQELLVVQGSLEYSISSGARVSYSSRLCLLLIQCSQRCQGGADDQTNVERCPHRAGRSRTIVI